MHEGWLVVERDGAVVRLPWSSSNGWGTSRGAETVVWRDWTGDGVEDALVVVHETVTEAGSAGRTLEVWGGSRSGSAVHGAARGEHGMPVAACYVPDREVDRCPGGP